MQVKPFIRDKQMLLVTLRDCFGNLIIIWFFFAEFEISSLSDYSWSAIKKAKLKGKYRQKYITWDPKTTLHLKNNVSPTKIYYKILGQLEL